MKLCCVNTAAKVIDDYGFSDLEERCCELEKVMHEALMLMNDSRNLGIIEDKFKKLLSKGENHE